MDQTTKKMVYINPNFKRNLQPCNGIQIAPHINPLFNGDKKSMLNDLKTSIDKNLFNQSNFSTKNCRIHVNPKMLNNFDLKSFEKPPSEYIGKSQDIRNKFSKVNPRRPPESILPNDQLKSSVVSIKVRKPNHSLVRNQPNQNLPSISNQINFNPKKYNITKMKLENRSQSDNPKTKRNLLQRLVKKYQEKSNLKLRRQTKILNSMDISKVSQSRFVYIGGEKYLHTDSVLRRVVQQAYKPNVQKLKKVKQILIKGIVYKRKSDNVFTTVKKFNSSQMKKNNITCPIFRRLGKCKRHDNGKCHFVHDRKHVMICKKYLNGACKLEGCFLSHDIVIEKMPTCRFYLKGCCARDDCPYLHVKVNDDANVCPEFLQGYCAAGVNCIKVHIDVCPAFHKFGKCDVQNCKFPHKRFEFTKLDVETSIQDKNTKHDDNEDKNQSNKSKSDSSDNLIRYYLESEKPLRQNESEIIDDTVDEKNAYTVDFKNRPTVGNLPSFIAI